MQTTNPRPSPTWGTVVSTALSVACLVAIVFLWWSHGKIVDDLKTEAAWRGSMHGKVVELLTIMEHAQCDELDELRESLARIRDEVQSND